MRFKINCQIDKPQTIPINYQYPLSAWIYKVFNRADPAFANWLHRHGYQFNGNRRYKLFTFSKLQLPQVKLNKESAQLRILSRDNQWQLSFSMEEAGANFIKGLFQDQQIDIADSHTRGQFHVTSVERLPDPDFSSGVAEFRCLSPITLSKPKMAHGHLRAEYLAPGHPDFGPLLMDNLVRRYATAQNRVAGLVQEGREEEALLDLPFDRTDWHFEPLTNPRSRLLVIKAGTPQETKVRGYEFHFRLRAASELLHFGHAAGFGEKGSMGFGCVEVVR